MDMMSLEVCCHSATLTLSEPSWRNHSHKQTCYLLLKKLKTNQSGQDQRLTRKCKILKQLRLKLKKKKRRKKKVRKKKRKKVPKRKVLKKKLLKKRRKKNHQTGHQRSRLLMLALKTHTS